MAQVERIIFIDDNEMDNAYHQLMVERAGFKGELLVFEEGDDAIRFLETDRLDKPTYIFLDINMPVMDGFQVASKIAPLLADKPTVVVVMLTSSASPRDVARAKELPVIKDYLTKPMTVDLAKQLLARELA